MPVNPMKLMKLAGIRKKFEEGHPKVVAFFSAVIAPGLPEGTVIELTVTKPGEAPVTSSMKVSAEDAALMQELKDIAQ